MFSGYKIPRKAGINFCTVVIFVIKFFLISEIMPKRNKESSSDSSSGSESSSDSSDTEREDRSISGDRSTSGSENEDPRNQFLPAFVKPKPVKMTVSKFAKSKLRSGFLGTPVGKDERVEMMDKYYCSQSDFKLFSAPRITGEEGRL